MLLHSYLSLLFAPVCLQKNNAVLSFVQQELYQINEPVTSLNAMNCSGDNICELIKTAVQNHHARRKQATLVLQIVISKEDKLEPTGTAYSPGYDDIFNNCNYLVVLIWRSKMNARCTIKLLIVPRLYILDICGICSAVLDGVFFGCRSTGPLSFLPRIG